jgi:hypothetical protein
MSHASGQWYPSNFNVNSALAGGEAGSIELFDSWSQQSDVNRHNRTVCRQDTSLYFAQSLTRTVYPLSYRFMVSRRIVANQGRIVYRL